MLHQDKKKKVITEYNYTHLFSFSLISKEINKIGQQEREERMRGGQIREVKT